MREGISLPSATRRSSYIANEVPVKCEFIMNIWFQFMYSQKRNCAASLFPKQNYNVLFPNFHIHESVSDLYHPRIRLPILQQLNKQTDPGNI